jgi:hypothetical protein
MKWWALALGVASAWPAAAADSRQVEFGLENLYYRTASTALNRDNVLGLSPGEDLLRGTLGWKESRGSARGVFRGFVERRLGGNDRTEARVRQAYLQYDWGDGLSLRLGKQRVAWGSGFAWNPTSRLEPPKNPLNTGLEQEGAWAARADWVPASWASVTLVGARTAVDTTDVPYESPARARRTAAVRARFLVRDTDLALVYAGGKGQRTLVGLDAGRSFGSVSAHAEAAAYRGAELLPPRDDERFFRLAAGALWVKGEWSAALEYFWNGEGYDDARRAEYLAALEETHALSVDPRLPPAGREQARRSYLALSALPTLGGLGLGRQYVQAAGTWADDSGRWTASLRGLCGLTDAGIAFTPGVTFAPRGDLTLHLDAVVLWGAADSEYRLAPLRGAVQSRVRLLF